MNLISNNGVSNYEWNYEWITEKTKKRRKRLGEMDKIKNSISFTTEW